VSGDLCKGRLDELQQGLAEREEVSYSLGHATPAVTWRVYYHHVEQLRQHGTADAMDRLFATAGSADGIQDGIQGPVQPGNSLA
jgi:hypothetical protein